MWSELEPDFSSRLVLSPFLSMGDETLLLLMYFCITNHCIANILRMNSIFFDR